MEAIAHDMCPHTRRGPELGHFFKQVIVAIEEKGKASRKGVYIQACIQSSLYIADSIGKGKGYFLHSSRASLAHMIAADADRIPARQILGAKAEHIGDDAHRILRRGAKFDGVRATLLGIALHRACD